MTYRERYEKAKRHLLKDRSICAANRKVFREFFAFEEYKLKRQNRLAELDEGCHRTLLGYINRFRNINTWFQDKPWKDLTKADIKRVYDGLEDGKIRNCRGEPFKDVASYYGKVFKSEPFRLVGKAINAG